MPLQIKLRTVAGKQFELALDEDTKVHRSLQPGA
jgi:hypothetical protein